MDLSFYPLTLEALDEAHAQANAEALCLFVGEDERPLVGLAGLCDWRLSGGLSRMLRKGLIKGEEGEAVLTPGSRLGFRKLFLFGMGPGGQGEDELSSRLAERLRRLGRAGVEDAAFQIPLRIPLDLGIRTLIDEPSGPLRARVFGADPAAMVRALSHAASRGPSDARHERRVIKVPPSHKAPPLPPRKGGPVRSGLLEIPKATPLSFAPSAPPPPASPLGPASSQILSVPPVTVSPEPQPGLPSPGAAPTPSLPPSLAPALPSAAAHALASTQAPGPAAQPLADSEPPIAPPVSDPPEAEVPIAPPVDPTPLPPGIAPASAASAPDVSEAQAGAPGVANEAAKSAAEPQAAPRGGKASLPIDYKAPRFVPPEPRPEGGKKGKRKKR